MIDSNIIIAKVAKANEVLCSGWCEVKVQGEINETNAIKTHRENELESAKTRHARALFELIEPALRMQSGILSCQTCCIACNYRGDVFSPVRVRDRKATITRYCNLTVT